MIIDGVRINYGVLDQTIDEDTITDTSSENSDYSDAANTIGASEKTKIAYLENDYFLLDGSYVFPEAGVTYNVGWESESLSDISGNINEYIEYQFSALHDSYGVQFVFPTGCPADSFSIAYYNGNTQIGTTTTVTGNTATAYTNFDVRLQWNRVRITFTKVNPQQRARLWQVVFGINDVYDEDMLISVSATKTTDLTGDYEDCGEVSFQFFNDGRFDIRTINDLPIGLQEGLKITVYVKKKGSAEYVLFGNYYSENTNVEENGRIITVSGFDELYSLNDSTFNKGVVYTEGRSLAAWAQEVADDAGIEIEIDSAFNSIISKGYITEVPHREALRLIAEAGNGILYVTSSGKIALKKHTPTTAGTLTGDEIVDGTYIISNDEKILGINVMKYSYAAAQNSQELGNMTEVGLTATPQEIEIVYSAYPVLTDTVQILVDTTTSATVSNVRVYADRCVFDLSGEDGDSTWITLTGKPYNVVALSETRGSTVKNIKKIENNFLITQDIAGDVADYQYARVVNKYKHVAEIVTDTDIDVGDEVGIKTDENETAQSTYVNKLGFAVSYLAHETTVEVIDE